MTLPWWDENPQRLEELDSGRAAAVAAPIARRGGGAAVAASNARERRERRADGGGDDGEQSRHVLEDTASGAELTSHGRSADPVAGITNEG